MRLLYSGLNGPGCDLSSRIHGCPVEGEPEEHSLGRIITLDLKKKKKHRKQGYHDDRIKKWN